MGIAFALILHQNIWARSLARGLVLFPYLLPMVVAVLVWKWLFNDLYGILNHLLMASGLRDMPVDWLGSMPNAMISLILVGSWKYFPFVVLAVLARLQTIPEALYEAARLDGAGPWGRFWDITLPQLRSVLGIVILLRAIWDFKEFDLIFMMTGGGPVTNTQTLPLLVYKYAFPLMQMGAAATVAVLMMLVMLAMIWPTCASRHAVRRRDGDGRGAATDRLQPPRLAAPRRDHVSAVLDVLDRAAPGARTVLAAAASAPRRADPRALRPPDHGHAVPGLYAQQRNRRRRDHGRCHRDRAPRRLQPVALPLPRAPPDGAARSSSPTSYPRSCSSCRSISCCRSWDW